MSGRILTTAIALVVLASCQASAPARQESPARRGSAAAQPATADGCEVLQEHVDALLESAYNAVAEGNTDEAFGCEATIVQLLARCHGACEDLVTCSGSIIDELLLILELARLAEEGEAATADTHPQELLPDPQAVSPDVLAEESARAAAETFDLPVEVNSQVASLIEYYTGRHRERFAVALERSGRYLPFIREELRRAGLPQDLAYLPFVESAFNPRARSRASAHGLWQFMKGTARLYGLRCDALVDERNDPFLATTAAVAHLAELHATFDSWELALAAYNSGSGRVQRALRRARGDRNFWTLRRYLPRETRNYVPAFWAVLVIVKNLEAHGFEPIQESSECLARVPVEGALDIEILAEHASIAVDDLADLNPALTYRLTPDKGRYLLAVSCGQEEPVRAALHAIPPNQRIRSYLYVVRSGDTLGAIARAYGSSVDAIVAANPGVRPRSLRIGRMLVVPRSPVAIKSGQRTTVASRAGAPSSRGTLVTDNTPGRYTVRPGDTLFAIARRFGLSVGELKRANGLQGSLIHPGDILVLVPPHAGS